MVTGLFVLAIGVFIIAILNYTTAVAYVAGILMTILGLIFMH